MQQPVLSPVTSGVDPQPVSTRQRWAIVTLLFTCMVFCYAQRGALSIAAPFMMQELNLSPAVMGVLLSAFFWSYSFMQMPAGWMVDRFGVRRAFAWGYAFWSVASAFTGFARGLTTLVAARMLLGIGQSVAFPAAARAVANWFEDRHRGTVTAVYMTGVRVGQALIATVGVVLLTQWGFLAFFVITGVVPLVWLLPWNAVMGRLDQTPDASDPQTRSSTPPSGTAPRAGRLGFLQSLALFRFRTVHGIFWGYFAYDYVWFLYVLWLPGYLKLERGFSTREMAIYSSVPYLVMIGVILASGVASDWLIRSGFSEMKVRKGFIAAGLTVACLIVPAGIVEDKMTAVWLLTISMCGLGLCTPNTWGLTQAACSRGIVGTVSGIMNFGGNLGGMLAPVITGYIVHATGSFALALSVAGGMAILGIVFYLFLIGKRVEV